MRKVYLFLLLMTIVSLACQKEEHHVDYTKSDVTSQNVLNERVRTYSEALDVAEKLLVEFNGEMTRCDSPRKILADQGQCIMRSVTRNGESLEEPMMYIFNNEDNNGFTVIAADRTISPVIAITESGSYTYGEPTGNEAFDLYMEGAVAELQSLLPPPTGPITPILNRYYITYDELREKAPLLTTKWGQWDIYNDYCPNGAPAGCAVIAIAQIMAYHRYPTSFTTTYSSEFPYGESTIALNWEALLQHVGEHGHTDTCNPYHYQLSALCREIGERAGSMYSPTSTPTHVYNVPSVLHSFGYDASTLYLTASQLTIYDNLDMNRPVYMRGEYGEDYAHAWVVDGYYDYKYGVETYVYGGIEVIPIIPNPNIPDGYVLVESTVTHTKLLHINWGWSGLCNGWFNWGNYKPSDAEEYDDIYNSSLDDIYTELNMIIGDIYPEID